jgi:hypothetical protein
MKSFDFDAERLALVVCGVAAIALIVCMTIVNMTPEPRCEDACGHGRVARVTANECVCVGDR